VAEAIDAMAERIEHQMKEERQLLAFVSHELRTPMARIRVLTDLARAGHATSLNDIDREVADVDYLVANILARSRLEFGTLSRKPIRLPDAVLEALDRASLPASLLTVTGDRAYEPVLADPTLLHRAIANLVDNAQRHGGGLTGVQVRSTDAAIVVDVLDSGPGFGSSSFADRFKAFSPSAGEGRGSGLGLGMNLVQRIVVAHGGRVWAENRPDGGARVGIEVPLPKNI
jgi:signal transduction histidine kinase